MTHFEFLVVLVSIVVAFALSEMVASWGRLLRARRHIRHYWVHTVWSVLLVVFMISFWWELWQYRLVEQWSFPMLLSVLTVAITLVLAAYLFTPDRDAQSVDVRAHYFENAPLFFGLSAAGIIWIAISDLLIEPGTVGVDETAIRLVWAPLAIWAARSKSERVHIGIAIAAAVLMIAFIAASGLVSG